MLSKNVNIAFKISREFSRKSVGLYMRDAVLGYLKAKIRNTVHEVFLMHKISDNRQYVLISHEDVLVLFSQKGSCPVSRLLEHLENISLQSHTC